MPIRQFIEKLTYKGAIKVFFHDEKTRTTVRSTEYFKTNLQRKKGFDRTVNLLSRL